jgi:hypothetical protein
VSKSEISVDALISRNNNVQVVPLPTAPVKPRKFDLSELDSNRITDKTSFPEPVPTLSVNGSAFAVERELSIITGLPKAGKSAVLSIMIAAPFVAGRDVDTLTITAPAAKGRNIIYIDTEMSKGSTQKLHNQVLRILDTETTPSNLRIWNWKKYSPNDRIEALKATFELIPDLHLIFLDGIADFMLSVNDEVKANELLEWLTVMAEERNCSIVTVIHENFGNGQARGHIGSGLGRKCAGTISIKKDRAKDITSIECKTLRHAQDFMPVFCQWNIDHKRLMLVDETISKALTTEARKTPEERKAEKEDANRSFLVELLARCFGSRKQMPRKELIDILTRLYDPSKFVTDKTAGRAIKEALEFELLDEVEPKVYQLTDVPF